MRLLPLLAALSLLTACGDTDRPAKPTSLPATPKSAATRVAGTTELACPRQIAAATPLPPRSRVLGSFNGTLPLLQAEMSTLAPDEIEDHWGLGGLENDEEEEYTELPDGGSRTVYALKPLLSRVPGEAEQYMLACSYASDWQALSSRTNAALALIPVPVASTARCEIIEAPSKEGKAQPPRSATCQVLSAPRETPPEAQAFLERVYAGYASDKVPDPLGADAPQLFATELLAMIREQQQFSQTDEGGPLESDPLCACGAWQTLTVQRISIVAIHENEATAKVNFTNTGKPVQVGMNLLRESGQWRISDLAEPAPWGLAQYLFVAKTGRRLDTQ